MERFCLVDDCASKVLAKSLCSRHYYNYRNHGTPLPESLCADCGTDLSGGHMGRERCTPCAAIRAVAMRQARLAARKKVRAPRDCYRCGAKTEPTAREKKLCEGCAKVRAYPCSDDSCERPTFSLGLCSMHYKRVKRAEGAWSRGEWNDARRDSYHRRRALKAGSTAGPAFTNADVFERDGWVCGLCDESVSPDAVYPDPLSASLDHVVPLSRGGAHSFSNSQLAHLSCNVRKGAREDVPVMA